jgi:fatty acid desaturase
MLSGSKAGRSNRSHAWRYGASILGHAALLAASVWALHAADSAAAVGGLALLAALAVVQLGILAHDASHRQIARGRRASRLLSLALWNAACGISAAWWRDKHARHHRHPNQVGLDPDAYDIFSFFPEDALRSRGLRRLVARQQAAAFVLVVAATAAYFQLLSLRFLLRERPRGWRLELAILALRHAVFFFAVLASLPAAAASGFLALHYLLAGWYLGAIFATNHYGLPMSRAGAAAAPGLFEATRNVRTGPLGDYLFGGVNYQIEHHLAPGLPRFALRGAAAEVRAHCARHALPYHECGWGEALGAVLRSLQAAGSVLRKA